jgi:hypothetical protein
MAPVRTDDREESSKMAIVIRATRRDIPEDGILHYYVQLTNNWNYSSSFSGNIQYK